MNNFEMQPTTSGSKLSFETSSPTSITFKNKKINKHKSQGTFLKNIIGIRKQTKEIDSDNVQVTKSLREMCSSAIPRTKKEENLTHVAYAPVTTDASMVLIASLPRKSLFTDEDYAKLPINDVKRNIAEKLMNIPSTPGNLAQQARRGLPVYNFHTEYEPSQTRHSTIEIEQIQNTSIELKVWEGSIIYVKKYYDHLVKEIYHLTHECAGSICIESNISLFSDHEIYELKKNEDMRAILETIPVGEKYNFNICVNTLIPILKEPVYLNFFNIPAKDLENILKNPHADNLHLTPSPI